MNLSRLYEILKITTAKIYSGQVATVPPDEYEIIDFSLLSVVVNKKRAQENRSELIALLKEYPNPETLKHGPSYIAVGADIGDQGAAFQLFALGKVLKLWSLVTPQSIGLIGEKAKQAAGTGWVIMTGFDKDKFYGD